MTKSNTEPGIADSGSGIEEKVCSDAVRRFVVARHQMDWLVKHWAELQQVGNVLLFKGSLFAHQYYGELARRPSTDIDLLCPPDRVGAMEDWLWAHAFRPWFMLNDRQSLVYRRCQNAHTWTSFKERIQVDLHWRLEECRWTGVPEQMLFQRAVTCSYEGREFRTFSPGDYAWYMQAHGQRHQWNRPSYREDIEKVEAKGEVPAYRGIVSRSPLKRLADVLRPTGLEIGVVSLPWGWGWLYYVLRVLRLLHRVWWRSVRRSRAVLTDRDTENRRPREDLLRMGHQELALLLGDFLNSGSRVEVPVHGASMSPFIRGGSLVGVEPVAGDEVRCGDILVVRTSDHRVLVHRAIRKREGTGVWLTRGDACWALDVTDKDVQILGRVYQVRRGAGLKKMDQGIWSWLGRLWVGIHPMGVLLITLYRTIRPGVQRRI